MKINDDVYGLEEIKERVLIELINSKSVQRLKEISQFGLPDKYYHKKNFSRYDHSLGVLILLRRMGADLKEQIAGLLHDVSHTAFSHVVDWVIGDPLKEDYQDKTHLKFIESSEIPSILKKYDIDYQTISITKNFHLLDRESPKLCADRIDYSLREISQEKSPLVDKIVSNIHNQGQQIVFKDEELAEIFAREYMYLQKEHWAGEQAKARYHILAQILKKALQLKIIFNTDFIKTDRELISLLIEKGDKEILAGLKLLEMGFNLKESDEGIELKKKFRYVDPEILVDGKIFSLSEISREYHTFLENEKQKSNNFKKVLILKK